MAAKQTTKPVTVRLPVDLIDWIATQSGTQTDVIVSALQHLRDGPVIVDAADAARVAKLEDEIRKLCKALSDVAIERDEWRDRAKAIVSAADREPTNAVATKRVRDVDPLRRHPAGPVMASAVPEVPGNVRWTGLKAGKR